MSTLGCVYNRIQRFSLGHLFTTRQFLGLGSRGAVDQSLYNLVKQREIIRVARGVFMRKGSPQPSVFAVAKIKAESFGKRIFTHGIEAARQLGFPLEAARDPVFAVDGRSSSFRFGDTIIRLIGLSPRNLIREDSLAGLVIRAMWQVGKGRMTPELVSRTYPNWGKVCPQLEQSAPFLPHWMNNLFNWARVEVRRWSGSLPRPYRDWAWILP